MQKILFLLLALLFITACVEDFNKERDNMYYTPTYSVPIGPLSYRMDEIMSYLSLDSLITDTLEIPPSGVNRVLAYDDTLFYVNPVTGYDTTMSFTYDFSLLPQEEEYIQSAMLRVNYANGLPVNIAHQYYMFDENDLLLDSLYDDGASWIPGAQVDEMGNVIATVPGRTETYLDSSEVRTLFQTTRFELFLLLETFNEGTDTLWVYSDQVLDLQLAVRTELLVPLE